MATLNIGGQRVKVSDDFLRMSPEQQQAAVEEIAASLGGGQQPGNANFSPETQASMQRASQASQMFSGSVPPRNAQPAPGRPDLMGATAATLGGMVNAIPVIGPMAQGISDNLVGLGAQLTGGDYAEARDAAIARRQELAAANPVANIAGNIAGATGAFGVGGMSQAGSQALGLTGKLLPSMVRAPMTGPVAAATSGFQGGQMLNSGLSTLGLMTADNMVRGQAPTEALANAVAPGAISAAMPVVGAGIRAGSQRVADAATRRAQDRLTSAAIENAPDAATLRSAASQMFDASTGGTPLAVTDNAFFRFLGNVKQYADKLRINPDNDPQATGLLSTLMRIADDTANGVAVDLKDLHLVRQLARKVANSNQGRDASMGQEVIRRMDEFINTLKPSDIMGGANPTEAANNLLKGISTWSRASKVGIIEEAIEKAGTYKSGLENGLRLQFQALLRNPNTRRLFSAAERAEIEKVANGTVGSNLVTLLGKFGFGTNGAGNMLGGTIGSSLGATVGSALGPAGSLAGAALATGAGAGARRLSERMGVDAANRVAQVVATPGIQQATQRQVPQSLLRLIEAGQLGARGAVLGGAASDETTPLRITVQGAGSYGPRRN